MIRFVAALALACALSNHAQALAVVGTHDVPSGLAWGVPCAAVIGVFLALVIVSVRSGRETVRGLCALAALAVLIFGVSPALADPACDAQYLDGRRPILAHGGDEQELCNVAFVTLWSPATRDPVYSAEHLTAAGLTGADKTARLDAFHADPRLPAATRATLRDYAASRFDRGHMAPAHDMPTPEAMRESFVLSNMVPQSKPNNRGPWAQIEESARTLVVSVVGGPGGWIVTGPAFSAAPLRLKGRIAIPNRIWKAIYVPGDASQHVETVVGAWIVKNAADPETRFVSLDALKAKVGIDPFPSLSAELHAAAALPAGARKRTGVAE